MILFSFLKTLVGQQITVELKNGMRIRGILRSVDQFHNVKLDAITVVNLDEFPHLAAVRALFIRGSVVRYFHLPATSVDTALLQDASRREARASAGKPILGN